MRSLHAQEQPVVEFVQALAEVERRWPLLGKQLGGAAIALLVTLRCVALRGRWGT